MDLPPSNLKAFTREDVVQEMAECAICAMRHVRWHARSAIDNQKGNGP